MWMGCASGPLGWICKRDCLEQTVELGVDLVGDGGEVFRTVLVVEVVCFYDEDFAFVVGDPLLVAVVEVAEVFDADAFLVLTAALLDLCHQGRDGGLEVDQEVWLADHGHHEVEQVHVGVEVSVGEVAHGLVVGNEDVYAFKDGPVLDDDVV